MAKELDWKSSKAATPRGFESHVLRQNSETCFRSLFYGSVKNVGVEDTPRISEPLSFFEKTLFSSAPTGVSHR